MQDFVTHSQFMGWGDMWTLSTRASGTSDDSSKGRMSSEIDI